IIAGTLATAGHPATDSGARNGAHNDGPHSHGVDKNGVDSGAGNDADQSHDVIGLAFLSTAANATGLDESRAGGNGSSADIDRPGATVSPEAAHYASAGMASQNSDA
ncbi:hypothetical protein, partial [Pseudarthrobacter sp. NamE5]|uniref:hypothetical protein n=1 Tax=Pseudarthrobacter sp. NamE5 TaxID=2576839 RepID=UPI0014869EFF